MDKFAQYCWSENARLQSHGPSQWLGLALASCARHQLKAHALNGFLYDQAVCHAIMSPSQQWRALCCYRDGKKWRRYVDLAHDIDQHQLSELRFVSTSSHQKAQPLGQRHLDAVDVIFQKDAQRRNLGRLFAHAERLAQIINTPMAYQTLMAANEALEEKWHIPSLVTWAICSRFYPIRFQRRGRSTKCVVAMLYMQQRKMEMYTALPISSLNEVRVDLLCAIRALNDVMGWRVVGTGLPERLVMTQGDLKKRPNHHDDDPPSHMQKRIMALANRNEATSDDAALWTYLARSPDALAFYLQHRHHAEHMAERVYLQEPSPTWFRRLRCWLFEHRWKALVVCCLLLMLWFGWSLEHATSTRARFAPTVGVLQHGQIESNADLRVQLDMHGARLKVHITDGKHAHWQIRSTCPVDVNQPVKMRGHRVLNISNRRHCANKTNYVAWIELYIPQGNVFDLQLHHSTMRMHSTVARQQNNTNLAVFARSSDLILEKVSFRKLALSGHKLHVEMDRVESLRTSARLGIADVGIHGVFHMANIALLKGNLNVQLARKQRKGTLVGVVGVGNITATVHNTPTEADIQVGFGQRLHEVHKTPRSFESSPGAPLKLNLVTGIGDVSINE